MVHLQCEGQCKQTASSLPYYACHLPSAKWQICRRHNGKSKTLQNDMGTYNLNDGNTLNLSPSKWNLVESALNDGDPINPILITNMVNEIIIKKKSQK